jgi:hypothetical protein
VKYTVLYYTSVKKTRINIRCYVTLIYNCVSLFIILKGWRVWWKKDVWCISVLISLCESKSWFQWAELVARTRAGKVCIQDFGGMSVCKCGRKQTIESFKQICVLHFVASVSEWIHIIHIPECLMWFAELIVIITIIHLHFQQGWFSYESIFSVILYPPMSTSLVFVSIVSLLSIECLLFWVSLTNP